jgi:hypothetical protein
MEDFAELFEDLEDPRTGNAKCRSLHEIVVIALCTALSGGEELSRSMGRPCGAPSAVPRRPRRCIW